MTWQPQSKLASINKSEPNHCDQKAYWSNLNNTTKLYLLLFLTNDAMEQ